jgi:hypothetical protein
MQHRPAHLPNAYSPQRVEGEFLELRLNPILGSSAKRSSEKFAGRDSETVHVVMRVAPYSDIT